MALNLDSLSKSIDSLRRSIDVCERNAASPDEDIRDTLRAGVIQNFEVAYEQCWKMIQRWIRENNNPEDADNPRTRKDLFRMAARFGLIADPLPWFTYGESRNLTSHTYDVDTAASVYKTAKDFLNDAEFLKGQLVILND